MNKIYICSIMKNEEHNIENFYNSCKDADGIFILDTGSTDGSVEKARNLGINVSTVFYSQFRYDVARNDALKLLPQDDSNTWVISLDLDERLSENWKENFKNIEDSVTQLKYLYIWNWFSSGKPKSIYYNSRIFRLNKYIFKHATHEVLVPLNNTVENRKTINLTMSHYHSNRNKPDDLTLLELDYKENSDNKRSSYYLARQYFYKGMWDESIKYFIEYLNHPRSDWKEERALAMRFVAKTLMYKGEFDKSIRWFFRALGENLNSKDVYVEICEVFKLKEDWISMYWACKKCLEVENSFEVITDIVEEDYKLWDYLSVSSFQLGYFEEALKYAIIASEKNPNNKRLKDNIIIIEENVKKE